MITSDTELSSRYEQTLTQFLSAQSEEALYHASLLSKGFVEQGIGPEEIVALHSDTLDQLLRHVPLMERARVMAVSLQFLLEIMITYGIRYKEYLDLRMAETTRSIQMQMQMERLLTEEKMRMEQVRAEERMRAQAEALKSKEDFLAFIAHELRNPITLIKGSVQYALRRAQQEGSERVQHALGGAQTGLDRLSHLTEELLLLSREEHSDLSLNIAPLALRDLIVEATDAWQPNLQAQGLTLHLDFQEPVPTVFGDRAWLRTVLDNLLGNALKYSPDGGTVTVRSVCHARRVQVDVVDTGVGIPSEALPFIFDKYYRAHSQANSSVQGTGLGLALVKRIVERHGGDVRVQSQVGQGSTFSIYLPLAGPGETAATDEPANG